MMVLGFAGAFARHALEFRRHWNRTTALPVYVNTVILSRLRARSLGERASSCARWRLPQAILASRRTTPSRYRDYYRMVRCCDTWRGAAHCSANSDRLTALRQRPEANTSPELSLVCPKVAIRRIVPIASRLRSASKHRAKGPSAQRETSKLASRAAAPAAPYRFTTKHACKHSGDHPSEAETACFDGEIWCGKVDRLG